MQYEKWPAAQFGVIFTLFLALLTLWMWDKSNLKKPIKVLIVIGMCFLSLLGDWPILDIVWPLYLFIYRDDEKQKWKSFILFIVIEAAVCNVMQITSDEPFRQVFQFGALMVPPILMYLYNGQPGSKHPIHKWFFYIFYPAHMLVLALLKVYVF